MPPSPTEQVRTEYRVVWKDANGRGKWRIVASTRMALDHINKLVNLGTVTEIRAQSRTVSETPWEDVTETDQETKGERNG